MKLYLGLFGYPDMNKGPSWALIDPQMDPKILKRDADIWGPFLFD